MNISFSPPDIREDDIAEVVDTLRSGWITTGPKTKLFESMLTDYCGCDGVACFSSQTSAAEMTLRLLGVGEGDEVITTSYTYTASASIIYHVGATPVLVDVQKDTTEMDYDMVERLITEKTKCIIPVDVAGVMCDYKRLYEIAESKRALFRPANKLQEAFGRVIIMADGAHSLGAHRDGRISGSVADFTGFSFHAVKNLTTAEGGAAAFVLPASLDVKDIYKSYMLLSLHGQDKDAFHKSGVSGWEYDIIDPLYKCNMTDIQAAMGISQLKRYEQAVNRRHEILSKYEAAFNGTRVKIPSHCGDNFRSSCHLCLAHIDGADEAMRNSIITEMGIQGVACNVHYKPLPLLTAYKKRGFDIADFPNAYEMYRNEITLPLHTLLTDEQVDYIIDCLGKIVNNI